MSPANWLRWPWALGALMAYYLPWMINPAAALTFNAYDFAEWTSLRPDVRGGAIPLLTPLLLRVLLGLMALLFGARALKRLGWQRWVYAVLALALALTLLPPLEFFRGAFDDPNYRQQFGLAVGTLIGLVLLAGLYRRRLSPLAVQRIEVGIALLGIVSALVGEILAQGVVKSLNLPAPMGIGVVIFVACLGLAGVSVLRERPETE